ncbi:MAG TPA: ATP-binding protein [Salinimicrobium sp.]|nr:ATP-binding protein [Salinimicrobium sp.]
MQTPKRYLTLKVLIGYLLIAALATVAVWFIYSQIIAFNSLSLKNQSNEKLFLVSEITTNLYETENISRRLVQSNSPEDLDQFYLQIQNVHNKINLLEKHHLNGGEEVELDTITSLLCKKTQNLEELLDLRAEEKTKNYYTKALQKLRKVDEKFGRHPEERFTNLKPHQRRVLEKIIAFAEEENQKKLTNKTSDSLVGAIKGILTELEKNNSQFLRTVVQKENELLDNDMVLNEQLRKLLSQIEQDEIKNTVNKVEASREMLAETSDIIIAAGVTSLVIILVFLTIIMKDITKSQQYRLELEEAKIFAETLLKRREQFMAAITHDLRSPLTTVLGYSSLMEKTTLETQQAHFLNRIKKSSTYLLRLVNDLLDFSKLDAGKMRVEKLPFNPKQLIEETVPNVVLLDEEKNVSVKLKIADEANVEIISDPFRIKQIISNLVSNAYKFTQEGEVSVEAFLEKKKKGYYLLIKVKDTGIGITKEKQQEIFMEFTQEDSQTERNFGGTGLGLAICKKLTELLGGSISVQSEKNMGSEFIVEIPVKKSKVSKRKNPESDESNDEK